MPAHNFPYFVLGLLVKQSMSGYDIRVLLKRLGWLLGNPSFGAIYPALHALLADGLVTVETTSQSNKRLRKIYTITAAGHQALAEWLAQAHDQSANIKSFVIRLILLANYSQERLIELVSERREVVVAHYVALQQSTKDSSGQVNRGQLLAIEYGLATAKAELDWLDQMLVHLHDEQEPSSAPYNAVLRVEQ